MIYTVHIKEIAIHTVRVEAEANADVHDVYTKAINLVCPDTIVDTTFKEEQVFIGDTLSTLSEELNNWCKTRGLSQDSADDILSRDDLSALEAAYLELFIKRWDEVQ